MAFAARLASKRKAEEGTSPPDDPEERGLGKGGMSALMRSDGGTIRNPFADDEDDEGSDEEGSDDEEDGDLGAGAGGSSSSWNRGGWWRGALGGKKQSKMASEKFGDGRDSDEEEEGEGEGGANSSEDEEFGDFALPEGQAGDVAGGVDAEQDNVLVKPLPLHPAPGAAGASGSNKGLMGLWPFTKKDKDKEGDEVEGSPETAEGEQATEGGEAEEKAEAADEPPVVLSEDGEKVQPTVEAKRRTSIEEPDEGEDEEVVV
ncbi:hypothetical protein N0V82_007650 [Gnomoniopsis sp. IMI 355080]|nr:hypothetical protein N0V82_007650 [Gnomoniopsis sp. IMI 355080]